MVQAGRPKKLTGGPNHSAHVKGALGGNSPHSVENTFESQTWIKHVANECQKSIRIPFLLVPGQ